MDNEKRITDLEIQLTFQENTIDALNEEVIRQQKLIDELGKKLELVISRLSEVSAPPAIFKPEDEIPPHY